MITATFIALYTLVSIMHGIMDYRFSVRIGLQPDIGDAIIAFLWPIELLLVCIDRKWSVNKIVEEYKWMWHGNIGNIEQTIDENE